MPDLSDIHAYCFTGFPGSGKSAAISVANKLDIPVVSMGDRVREGARDVFGPDYTGDQLGKFATRQREERGETWVAERTVAHVMDSDVAAESNRIVIDGVRSIPEQEYFDSHFGELTTTYIYAPPEVRLERIRGRSRANDPTDTDDGTHEEESVFTLEDLKERDDREGDWGLYRLAAYETYDERIENDDALPLNEFKFLVRTIIEN